MMTPSNSIFEDNLPTTSYEKDGFTNLDSLYCSHLWNDSCLRNAIITAPQKESQTTKYCYTCRGKIRKYTISNDFLPDNHSTPNGKIALSQVESTVNEMHENCYNNSCEATLSTDKDSRDLEAVYSDSRQNIPSISGQLDSSFRHKFTSRETHDQSNRQRLRKSLRGMGCIVNFALTESPVKKRTQIQACSIIVMIIAIVVISFILVNFTTPHYTHAKNASSTIVVPTINYNRKTSAITKVYVDLPPTENNIASEYSTSTEYITTLNSDENTSENVSSNLLKIRKNIRTYPRYKNHSSPKPKEIINRDLSQRFCTCQSNEICMLDENSGLSICRNPIDVDDPTGCGGLCALETEACHLVDKVLGVRVCRLLTMVICPQEEWRCSNGLCVPSEARCNGSIECYDRSDEMHCDCDLEKQFRCGQSISCFENSKICDRAVDCWDGFDEVNCTAECPKDEFTCTDGQCILSSRFCDGFVDCADGSDEPDGCGDCGAHEARCNNHRCIPRVTLCDGHDQCGDGTDELNCSLT